MSKVGSVGSLTDKLEAVIIRIAIPFCPAKGGSITHIMELVKFSNPYIKRQIIVAPKTYGYDERNDAKFLIKICRVKDNLISDSYLKHIPGSSYLNRAFFSYNVFSFIKNCFDLFRLGEMLIIVHDFQAGVFINFLLKLFKGKTPVIIMNHGFPLDLWGNDLRSSAARIINIGLIKCFLPDYYIQLDDGRTNNEYVKKCKNMGLKIKLVYHAIDTDFYKPLNVPKNDEFIILSNHRLDSFKRLDLAILSFKYFLDSMDSKENLRLKILGDGPDREELESLAKKLNISSNIDFLGEQNREIVRDEILASDIVIGTSLISNANRSIQEAMACEKPVIVFESIRTTDLFKDMENSITVSAGDLPKFAQKIKFLYENEEVRNRLGLNARKFIIENRNWDSRMRDELEIYTKLIHESNAQ
jgi:L-malate glycosyltransferase